MHTNNLESEVSQTQVHLAVRSLAAKVGQLMENHMKSIPPAEKTPLPEEGMLFRDYDADDSDSGLESIIW